MISANNQAGVELSGLYATQNTIQGNYLGTDDGGNYGELTVQAGNNTSIIYTSPIQVQQDLQKLWCVHRHSIPIVAPPRANNVISDNLISGNMVGVNITGQGSGNSGTSTAQGVPIGQDLVVGNYIGIDKTGMAAVPNFEYRVYIDNSAEEVRWARTTVIRPQCHLGQRRLRRRNLRRDQPVQLAE